MQGSRKMQPTMEKSINQWKPTPNRHRLELDKDVKAVIVTGVPCVPKVKFKHGGCKWLKSNFIDETICQMRNTLNGIS